jgi:hypothetical protein
VKYFFDARANRASIEVISIIGGKFLNRRIPWAFCPKPNGQIERQAIAPQLNT